MDKDELEKWLKEHGCVKALHVIPGKPEESHVVWRIKPEVLEQLGTQLEEYYKLNKEQPEALRLANLLIDMLDPDCSDAATELRRQHALIVELLDLLDRAKASLSDYRLGYEYGKHDANTLEAVRTALEKAKQ